VSATWEADVVESPPGGAGERDEFTRWARPAGGTCCARPRCATRAPTPTPPG